ncbi:hypothetical protein EW146_g9193 [Bondarzewia mesenterica]|uniref:DUF6532 domain-containing protein n=1 Tax=Bondarzewia mesenterica TaxID=1095465 RepID=A0A4S4L8J9_9AGAM|nr:hypothetical protein EW146_g9193 [Bondarzewia mesenterica]
MDMRTDTNVEGPRKAKMKALANLVWRKRGRNDGDDTTMGTKTSDGMLDVKKSSTIKGKRSSETAGKHAGTAATSKKQTRTAKPVPCKLKCEYAFIMDGPSDELNETLWESKSDGGMEDDNELMEMANGNSKMLQQMYTMERPHWDNSDGAEEENNRGRRDIMNEDSDIEEEQDEGRDHKEDRDDGANSSANSEDGTNGDGANGNDGMEEDHNEEQHDDMDNGAGDGDHRDGDHGSNGGDYLRGPPTVMKTTVPIVAMMSSTAISRKDARRKGAYKENLQALSKLKLSTNGHGKSANKQQAEDYGQTHFKNEDSSDEVIIALAPRKQPKAHHSEMKMHSVQSNRKHGAIHEVENEDDDSDEEHDSPYQFQGQCHENDKGWPRETWLAWPTTSGKLSVKKQSPIIRRVLTEAVDKVLEYICFEDTFPEMAQRLQFEWTTIASIAKSLGYNVPEGHICRLHGKVKDVAVNLLSAYYPQQAGKSKEVLALLHGYKYIFLVNKNNSIIDDSPYMHPIIAAIIFCQFIKPKLFNITKYTSSIRECADEHEVLAAMVHGALSEWQTGRWQEIFFTENSYTIDYHKHLASLKAIRKKNKVGYHNLVADIFDATSVASTPVGEWTAMIVDDESIIGLALANKQSTLLVDHLQSFAHF